VRNKLFNYSFFSRNITNNIPSLINDRGFGIQGVFAFNVEDFTMDVDEDHLEYSLILILVGACLLNFLNVDKFPFSLHSKKICSIRRVETPSDCLEILSWLSKEDKLIFLADAQRILDSLDWNQGVRDEWH
jgi:hypothetical protein